MSIVELSSDLPADLLLDDDETQIPWIQAIFLENVLKADNRLCDVGK